MNGIGTSNQSVPESWPLICGFLHVFFQVKVSLVTGATTDLIAYRCLAKVGKVKPNWEEGYRNIYQGCGQLCRTWTLNFGIFFGHMNDGQLMMMMVVVAVVAVTLAVTVIVMNITFLIFITVFFHLQGYLESMTKSKMTE